MSIDPGETPVAAAPGDSVCVNGVCLTLAPGEGGGGGVLAFDVITETLNRSSLGSLAVGHRVNLETSVTPTTPMGGHFVQGHVDAVGIVHRIDDTPAEWRLTVKAPASVMPFVIPKGSITIDGISLTLASVDVANETFSVAIIPTTLRLTNLGERRVGDRVNLESDMLIRGVVHWLQHYAPADAGLTVEKLREAGF